eukprot:6207740-Pleurochrysis_carterae.AAC.1
MPPLPLYSRTEALHPRPVLALAFWLSSPIARAFDLTRRVPRAAMCAVDANVRRGVGCLLALTAPRRYLRRLARALRLSAFNAPTCLA